VRPRSGGWLLDRSMKQTPISSGDLEAMEIAWGFLELNGSSI
jgi:hypothetical protein